MSMTRFRAKRLSVLLRAAGGSSKEFVKKFDDRSTVTSTNKTGDERYKIYVATIYKS